MKKCIICGKKKEITAFYKNPGNCDGYANKCKQCARAYAIKRRKVKALNQKAINI